MWMQIGSALSANKAFYSTELAKLMSEVESEVRDTLLPLESELRAAAEGSEVGRRKFDWQLIVKIITGIVGW